MLSNELKSKIGGILLYIVTKIILVTVRTKVIIEDGYDGGGHYVYGFWHGRIISSMYNMRKKSRNIVNLVSPSGDGELVNIPLKLYGYRTVRGSSGRDSVKSLVEMIKTVKSGLSGGFAVDGPKGPANAVKAGVIYTARKSGLHLVAISGAYDRKWIISKAWDKTQIPKPFAKCTFVIGKPVLYDKNEEIEKLCIDFGAEIDRVTGIAENNL